MNVLRSRDNPRVRRWEELAHNPRARRSAGKAIIEGPHLVAAYLAGGGVPACVIASEQGAGDREIASLIRGAGVAPALVSGRVFSLIAGTETPVGIAAEIVLPHAQPELAGSPCCALLDGIQDPANVGTILRSAAAFGVEDIVLGPGCADPWSPKALRAGMGAHFGLRIGSSRNLSGEIASFDGVVVCTVPQGGTPVAEADLSRRICWVLGSEGQGVSKSLAARADLKVTIPMPGTAESLNVAAAAAICFYERNRQLSTRGARS